MLLCILCNCSQRFSLDFIRLPAEHRCYKHQGHGSQLSQPSVQLKPYKKISCWYYSAVQFPTENALRATVAIGFCNRARKSVKKAFFPVTPAMVFRNSCMHVFSLFQAFRQWGAVRTSKKEREKISPVPLYFSSLLYFAPLSTI